MSANKKLKLWQEVDGKRVPVEIEVTGQLVIVSVTVGGKKSALEELTSHIITTGQDIQALPSEKVRKLMRFFSNETAPWFEECESLRKAYADELAELERRAAEMGVQCRDCDKGDLIRKYIVILVQKGIE